MAENTVVKAFQSELQELSQYLAEQLGSLTLFMVFRKQSDLSNAWTLLVGSSAFDEQSEKKSLDFVSSSAKKRLSPNTRTLFRRIAIARSNDPLFDELGSQFTLWEPNAITGQILQGTRIAEGYVMVFEPPTRSRQRMNRTVVNG